MNFVVIFAGGVGSRMGSNVPKQFLMVNDKPIIIHTIEKFSSHKDIDGIVVVSKAEYIEKVNKYISDYNIKKVVAVIGGGDNGQASIRNGVFYLKENVSKSEEDIVLIHDGVRPVIDEMLITNSIECVKINGNSIAVSKAIETVIKVTNDGVISETIDRSMCRNAKAPQCFFLDDIYSVHVRALEDGNINMIDSASLMSFYGYSLYITECEPENIKITTPNDYYMFEALFNAKEKNESY